MEVLHAMGKFLFDGQAWLNALIVTAVLAAIGIPLEIAQRRKVKRRYQAILERMREVYLKNDWKGSGLAMWIFNELQSPAFLDNTHARHNFVDDVHRALYELPRHPQDNKILVFGFNIETTR